MRIILRQKARNQFYSWYWNSNTTAIVALKIGSHLLLYINKQNNRHTTPQQTHSAFIIPRPKDILSCHKIGTEKIRVCNEQLGHQVVKICQYSLYSYYSMRYLALPGWTMTSLKHQNGYLNQRVLLFRLQYETRSLQMLSTKRNLYWCGCCTRTMRSHQRPPSWLDLTFYLILFVRCLIITLL